MGEVIQRWQDCCRIVAGFMHVYDWHLLSLLKMKVQRAENRRLTWDVEEHWKGCLRMHNLIISQHLSAVCSGRNYTAAELWNRRSIGRALELWSYAIRWCRRVMGVWSLSCCLHINTILGEYTGSAASHWVKTSDPLMTYDLWPYYKLLDYSSSTCLNIFLKFLCFLPPGYSEAVCWIPPL